MNLIGIGRKETEMAKQKSLIYNSVFNVLYQLLNVIFPFVTAIYVSHILMAEGVGKVAYAQNIASYFVTIAPLGLASYGVKEIAKTKDAPKKRNQCFSELFFINAVSTAIVVLIYYVIIFQINTFAEERLLYIVCGLPIVLNFINIDWFFQGMEEYAYITIRSFIIKIASLFFLFVLVRTKNDYVQYALITLFVGSANRIFNMVYLRKFIKIQWRGLEWKKHLKPVLILACNILLANLYSKVDITMLGYWKSDRITGCYANAFKIVDIILSLCIAMTDVFLPRLSYIFCSDKKKYSALLNQGVEIVLTIVFPAAIGISMLAPIMIPLLFGKTFVPAVTTVMLLSPLIVIKGFGNLACYQVAISSDNEKKQTIAYVFGCLINIILNTLLIPVMDQNGAAIASVTSEFVLNTVLFLQLRKLSGIHIRWRYLAAVVQSSLIMGVAVKVVLLMFPEKLAAGAAILFGILVYAFSGFYLGNEMIRTIAMKLWSGIRRKQQKKDYS